jgi:hypothetical protein
MGAYLWVPVCPQVAHAEASATARGVCHLGDVVEISLRRPGTGGAPRRSAQTGVPQPHVRKVRVRPFVDRAKWKTHALMRQRAPPVRQRSGDDEGGSLWPGPRSHAGIDVRDGLRRPCGRGLWWVAHSAGVCTEPTTSPALQDGCAPARTVRAADLQAWDGGPASRAIQGEIDGPLGLLSHDCRRLAHHTCAINEALLGGCPRKRLWLQKSSSSSVTSDTAPPACGTRKAPSRQAPRHPAHAAVRRPSPPAWAEVLRDFAG